ncbi:MAG: DUF5908 family protein [Chitinophagales bacterium]
MPIEIRELVIKTTIEDGTQKSDLSKQSINLAAFKERVIEECMEKVIELIERKAER